MKLAAVDRDWVSVPLGLAGALAVLTVLPVTGTTAHLLAITVFCISLWIATPIAPAITGIVCLGLIGVVFSTDLALTGFQSPTVWLVVFGLLLGEAARTSGLANWGGTRIEAIAFPTDDDTIDARQGYRRLLLVLSAAAVALAFLIPSALVRMLTISPIVIGMGTTFEDSRAQVGIFLGPILATFYAAPGIFTAGLPNIITTGIADSLGATTASWTAWTIQMFPLMGLGRAALVTAVVYWLYRPDQEETIAPPSGTSPMSGGQGRMLLFLLVGVGIWVTDGIHGLHPLYGAMAVVVLALLPRIGMVSLEDLADVDLSIVFFIGAVFAIGTGLARTGFAETAAEELLTVIPAAAPLWLVLTIVYFVTTAMTFVIEGLATASVLTPVLVSFAETAGLPLDPILMMESVALGTYFFPYQTVALVWILGEDVLSARELIRTVVVASVLSIVVLLPFQIALLSVLY